MKTNLKLSIPVLFVAAFIFSCNSSASDAKKVELKQAKPTESHEASMVEKAALEVTKTESLAVGEFIEGKHFVKVIPEIQTDVAEGKVEVAELFWLGCPHCYSLEPEVKKYKESQPDYVEFKQIPAMLNPSWASDANMFFISEILDPKGSKDLTTKLFDAIHKEKRQLRNPKAVIRFFEEQGYSKEQVDSARNSIAFTAKSVRAQDFGAKSQATSVPTLIVNGKYRTSPSMAGGNSKVMEVVKMLAEKENEAK